MTLDNILITHWDLERSAEDSFSLASPDGILEKHLTEYLDSLEDLEIFERRHNIVATNKGYYAAFYQRQVKLLNEKNDG